MATLPKANRANGVNPLRCNDHAGPWQLGSPTPFPHLVGVEVLPVGVHQVLHAIDHYILHRRGQTGVLYFFQRLECSHGASSFVICFGTLKSPTDRDGQWGALPHYFA